jgi:hypothetical protein
MKRLLFGALTAGALALCAATPSFAQNNANQNQASLRLVIVDDTGAGIPMADVTITSKTAGVKPVTYKSDEKGLAISPGLTPGDVVVHVEFPGFIPFEAPLNLKRGAQNQIVTLHIEGFKAEVQVNDATAPEAARSTSSFSLSQEEIDALPDDPDELADVLAQMAGPGGATFFMNGFSGGRLPSRDQIRSIRFRQNNYAADNHDAGRSQIEIVTRPNTNWQGQVQTQFGGDKFNARQPQQTVEQPNQERNVQFTIRGPIKQGRTGFSLNVNGRNNYNSSPIIAIDPFGNRIDAAARSTTDQKGFQFGMEHSINNNQGLLFNVQHTENENLNNGIGGFTLPERATNGTNDSTQYRFRIQGIVGGSKLHEFRVQVNHNTNESSSLTGGPTINVLDAFNSGGAGVNSNGATNRIEIADNFDFNIGTKHQMRVGVLVDHSRYSSFDQRNADGTWTYRTIEDYNANLPMQFSQRIGTLDIDYNQTQFGMYWSDEYRIHRDLSLGFGVRNEAQSRIDNKFNLMPRLGFSWAPFGSQRSAVRGGYGLFYDWYDSNLYSQTLRVDGITVQDIRITCSALNNYCAAAGQSFDPLAVGIAIAPSGRIQAADNLDMPRVHQASLSYDRQLTSFLTLQTSYQMLRGRQTMRSININAPVNGLRPNPAFGDITQFQSTGRTQSDRLTVQANFRLLVRQQQSQVRFSYQLGQEKNFADGATSLPSNNLNPDVDWGPSRQDIRHRFQAQGTVPLVYGIRVTPNFQVQSGVPYNLTTGFDDNNDGAFNDRPFGVTRNSLRGDWTWSLNLNVNKRVNLGRLPTAATPGRAQGNGVNFAQQGGGGFAGGGQGGQGGFGGNRGGGNQGNNNSRYSMEIFAQATNVLNHVSPQGYTGNLSSRFFGQATGVSQARDVNVGLRFNF